MDRLSNRQKDALMIVAMMLVAYAFFYSVNSVFPMNFSPPFDKLLYLVLVMVGFIQYAESRNKELNLKSDKRSYSVFNVFTISVFAVSMLIGAQGPVIAIAISTVVVFFGREMGRVYKKKFEQKFIGKRGKTTTKISKRGRAVIDGKEYEVQSDELIPKNTYVYVVAVDGNVMYVKKKNKK